MIRLVASGGFMNLSVSGKNLDQEQLEAALTNSTNSIIIAGAGAGK